MLLNPKSISFKKRIVSDKPLIKINSISEDPILQQIMSDLTEFAPTNIGASRTAEGSVGERPNSGTLVKEFENEPIFAEEPLIQSIRANTTKKIRRQKCPNGTRRNPRTGNCEPIIEKIVVPVPAPVPAPIPAPVPAPVSNDETEANDFEDANIEPNEMGVSSLEENVDEAKRVEDFRLNSLGPEGIRRSLLDKEELENLQIQESGTPLSLKSVEMNEEFHLDDVLATVPTESNDYLRQKEKIEFDFHSKNTDYDFLYPELNDPNFAIKIAKRKEFNDTKYDGTIRNIQEYADTLCKSEFELMPNQLFVKNFLSFQTPYNSLLLYHGLGSGKTCSAIGIAEEMRGYMKQIGMKQRIIVVASPNVQQNFRVQLFDERRLRDENGMWTIQSCIGNALVKEINPTSLKGIPREKVAVQINSMINQYYAFMGYGEFANYISKKTTVDANSGFSESDRKQMEIKNIRKFFNNRLIIVDEVHNISLTDDNPDKRTALGLKKLAKYCDNLRLLLLSATPMYNSHKEIIWLTELMNLNDKRGVVSYDEVFDKDGNFKEATTVSSEITKGAPGKTEGGRELLHRKLLGYVSYVRGENPYTFPYRIYPADFSPEHTFSQTIRYPKIQLNAKPIEEPMKNIPVYLNKIGTYQERAYQHIINMMRKKASIPMFEQMNRFGYTLLQNPLEALTITYPSPAFDAMISGETLGSAESNESNDSDDSPNSSVEESGSNATATLVGKRGLANIMTHTDDSAKKIPMRYNFNYKPEIQKRYGRIFNKTILPNYSTKIANICDIVQRSDGIIIIYSHYIDGGIVPIALALEEMGFARFGTATYTRSLFASQPTEPIDSLTMKPRSQMEPGSSFNQAKYVMITGDKSFSPQNAEDIKRVTSADNKNGEFVKVILISKAGAEGLDFKNIRQIHILDPWYNMNRIEQIIGRGVRNLSHCMLPFAKRNVEIYLHSTLLVAKPDEESADLYLYRLAEKKAVQIGQVTRLLKEVSVDCLLNIGQANFTMEKLAALAENQNIELQLSTKKIITYRIGDRPHTDICDYMQTCGHTCSPNATIVPKDIIKDTYGSEFVQTNNSRIMERIRNLFKDKYFYSRQQLINSINIVKQYPIEQIYSALTLFIKNKNEYLTDKYGRRGNLINRDTYYAFQPIEINDENISIYERSVPVEYKRKSLVMEVPKIFAPSTNITSELNAGPSIGQGQNIDASVAGPNAGPNAGPGAGPNAVATSIGENQIQKTERQYTAILDEMVKNLTHSTTPQVITSSDHNWYKHASTVVDHLQIIHRIGFGEIKTFFVRHMVDMLLLSDKLILVEHLYAKIREPANTNVGNVAIREIESEIKDYLDEKIITAKSITGIFLANKHNWIIYVQSKIDPRIWNEAEPEDIRDFELSGALDKFKANPLFYSDMIGFINIFKTGKEMVFRVKDITQMQNNTGTHVEGQIKANIVKRLNSILEPNGYSKDAAKEITQLGFCVIMEILMRYYTETKQDNKTWFLNSEQAIYNEITKYQRRGIM